MIQNELYLEDINYVSSIDLPWEKLKNKSILITGASGLMGCFLIDVLMLRNMKYDMNCKIYAVGRNMDKAYKRFSTYWWNPLFKFLSHDINVAITDWESKKVNYVLHMASNTHPVAYAKDPIGTISSNIIGTYNMLNFAVEHDADRFIFASSNEIYGRNRGDAELFDEHYCGYIDSNTLRAGYPESKRCGEALCQAFISQKQLDIVIPRFTRSFGPTLLHSDTKAMSQFLHKAISGENIVLKSAGTQYFSYTYVADAISGLLTVILKGRCGEAYNIADESCDIMLKDLAEVIAGTVGKKVVFELPDAVESAGFSIANKARLDGKKLRNLGWKPKYSIQDGVSRTIALLKYEP